MGHLIHLGLSKCFKIIFKVELELSKLDWPIHITLNIYCMAKAGSKIGRGL